MECGKLTAKLRDAVPVCFMVNDHEVRRFKNMTKAFPPEEIAAWREEDPEGFAKWAAENAEEYETWLKANPEYAEKK
jgi:hypothetical protein